ncbi:erythroid transcription factor-like, partial [Columba livia]
PDWSVLVRTGRGAGVRELRGDGDAAVAPGRHRPLPVQRLRALPPAQRPQPAPHPPQEAPAGEQTRRHRLQQLPNQHHDPVAPQPPRGPRLQRLRPLLQTAPRETPKNPLFHPKNPLFHPQNPLFPPQTRPFASVQLISGARVPR